MRRYLQSTLVISLIIAAFFVGKEFSIPQHTSPVSNTASVAESIVDTDEIARLSEYGTEYSIAAHYGSLALDLVFSDVKTKEVVTTLHVENPRHGPPAYKIVRGNKRDWLVITRFELSGTGYKQSIDDWYTLAGGMQLVLSYPSDYFLGTSLPGTTSEYHTVEIDTTSHPDDSAVDITTITKKCVVNKNSEEECTESSRETKTYPI